MLVQIPGFRVMEWVAIVHQQSSLFQEEMWAKWQIHLSLKEYPKCLQTHWPQPPNAGQIQGSILHIS